MGGQAVRSGGITHLSTHGAVFVVKGLKPRVRRGSSRAPDRSSQVNFRSRGVSPPGKRACEKALHEEEGRLMVAYEDDGVGFPESFDVNEAGHMG